MKWESSILYLISFLGGVLVCFCSLQFAFFEIKKEIDLPNLILSIITVLIGLFIAVTIQKRIAKSQNQHSYLVNKLDTIWASFNLFSDKLLNDKKVNVSDIRNFMKDVIRPTVFMKSLFNSFEIDKECICTLEKKLEKFEEKISNYSASENVISTIGHERIIEKDVLKINKHFSLVLKEIQKL